MDINVVYEAKADGFFLSPTYRTRGRCVVCDSGSFDPHKDSKEGMIVKIGRISIASRNSINSYTFVDGVRGYFMTRCCIREIFE